MPYILKAVHASATGEIARRCAVYPACIRKAGRVMQFIGEYAPQTNI
jgi:hypothetical protein